MDCSPNRGRNRQHGCQGQSPSNHYSLEENQEKVEANYADHGGLEAGVGGRRCPRHKDGAPNSMTPVCEKPLLIKSTAGSNVYVARVDERFSSVEVEEAQMTTTDDLAAQVILEQWFRENFIDNVN